MLFRSRDESGIPRYAHQRGTAGSFRLDVKGSDKAFNFCYRGEGERLFVFEAPIDLGPDAGRGGQECQAADI